MIIANHAHLMPEPGADAWWTEGGTDMLLEHIDYCEIDKVVVFPPFACQMEHDIIKANRWALEEVNRHPDRLIAAGVLNPVAENALELLSIFEAEGIKHAKVHPSVDLHDISAPEAAACYEKAEALGIALDYHTGAHGTRLSASNPEKFDDIAWKYPKLKMIFEHIGGRTYFEQFLAIISNHSIRSKEPCIFAGLTSILSTENNKFWYLGPDKVMDVIEFAGADKLIFGLDFPWNSKEINKKDIEIIQQLDISAEEKEKILGGNLLHLINS
jgi:predicted TIM-barrel fold metal-dependent hydrolase